MPPGAEPAVIQHVALNANGRRALGKFCKVVEILIEVNRLPDIEGYRAGSRWVALAGAEEAVEATGYGVEAVRVRAVDPWCGVRLVVLQDHFTRQQ